jgi:hypothetical protein
MGHYSEAWETVFNIIEGKSALRPAPIEGELLKNYQQMLDLIIAVKEAGPCELTKDIDQHIARWKAITSAAEGAKG